MQLDNASIKQDDLGGNRSTTATEGRNRVEIDNEAVGSRQVEGCDLAGSGVQIFPSHCDQVIGRTSSGYYTTGAAS